MFVSRQPSFSFCSLQPILRHNICSKCSPREAKANQRHLLMQLGVVKSSLHKRMAQSARLATGKGSRMYPMSPRVMRSLSLSLCACVIVCASVCVCYPWAKLMPFSWARFTVGLAWQVVGLRPVPTATATATAGASLWSLHWSLGSGGGPSTWVRTWAWSWHVH